jgi:hypothetical protein
MLWSGVPDYIKDDPVFVWEAIAANVSISSNLTADELENIGFDSNGTLYFSMFVKSDQLFGESWDSGFWSDFENEGLLRFDCEVRNGAIGVQGEMNLWLAPVDHDVDASDASRLAGQDDHWSCLSFLTCPSGDAFANPKIIIFFSRSTFFDDTALQVEKVIELEWDAFAQVYLQGSNAIFTSFFGFKRALEETIGAAIEVPGRRTSGPDPKN